ncbi:MAG: hypothetical protein HKN94_12010 [Acidimicrobiales bacterium]|nr:hypothetical protein [Acidimicrobiia bacterium]NNC80861.1 hypothetical protein [Acidimicrobiales bacterium]RZV47144.1 MAG: hypothetical protein EX269_05570 [Acidimicrobiales bacterium]
MYAASEDPGATPTRWVLGAAWALARHPGLWRTAIRLGRRHARSRWWATPPFLPLPDPGWLAFRYETAFASTTDRPTPEQFIEYLHWAKAWPYL